MGIFDTDTAHEDPNSLDVGFFGTIKNGWSNFLSSILGKTTSTMGKALGTGVGKGILFTLGTLVVGGLITGGLAGSANMVDPWFGSPANVASTNLVDGMINGAYQAAKFAFSAKGGWLLAIGATVGGVADVRALSHAQEAEAAAARVAAHKSMQAQGIAEQPQTQRATELVIDPYHPHAGWAERAANHSRNEGQGR
jgi:hypothetical protein